MQKKNPGHNERWLLFTKYKYPRSKKESDYVSTFTDPNEV